MANTAAQASYSANKPGRCNLLLMADGQVGKLELPSQLGYRRAPTGSEVLIDLEKLYTARDLLDLLRRAHLFWVSRLPFQGRRRDLRSSDRNFSGR